MEEVSKKLAPILQLGDHSDGGEGEGEVVDPEAPSEIATSAEEAMEVREAIRGRKESIIIKETKVL